MLRAIVPLISPSPWYSIVSPAPEREYLVLRSDLPLLRYRDLPGFVRHSLRIQEQLAHTPGLIGYSLLAKLVSRRFWTLSAWEDEAALARFVAADPHGKVMRALVGKMGPTRFVRWKVRGSALPPGWADALGREEETEARLG